MAGAAARLPQSGASDDLAGTMLSFGRGAIVAVGPWLLIMASLVLISVFAGPSMSRADISDFRGTLIYAFAFSLVAAAPFVLVTSRILSDAIYSGERDAVQPLMIAGSLSAGVAAALLSLAVGAFLGVRAEALLALVQAASLTGMMWVHLAIAGAMRDYRAISLIFVVGLVIATGATLVAAFAWRASSAGMVFAFNCGLAVVTLALGARELAGARAPDFRLLPALRSLAVALGRYRWIAAGAGLSAIAVWVDKWIIWAGPSGQQLKSGLVHAPLYDSAAFLAYLTIIPCLARFVMALDGEYLDAYRSYFHAIKTHATLDEIGRAGAALARRTTELIDGIFVQQAALCAIVVLLAPLIVEAAELQYAQVSILRLCTIAVLFQFLFLAASSLLIFFERHREFLFLQALFATLNAVCTFLTVEIGPLSYGFGFLVTSVVSGIAAHMVLTNVVRNIDYYTFIDGAVRMHERELHALRPQPSSQGSAWSSLPARGGPVSTQGGS